MIINHEDSYSDVASCSTGLTEDATVPSDGLGVQRGRRPGRFSMLGG